MIRSKETKIEILPKGVVGKIFRQEKIAYTINKKETNMLSSMRKILIVTVVAICTMVAFSPMANANATANSNIVANAATQFNGACGGGSNLNDAIKGWKKHGVLDDIVRMIGQTPGVDGPSEKIVRENLVRVVTTRGVMVPNYTCKGGSFVNLHKMKYLQKGFVLYVPKKYAPAPGKTKTVKVALQGNCGNKAVHVPVKRPGHKPKHKPKTKPPTKVETPTGPQLVCPAGWQMNTAGTQCTMQTNSAEQNCKDSGGTWDSAKNQCTTIQTNNNCGNVVVVNGSGNSIYNYQGDNCNQVAENCVNNGGNWNGDTNTCTFPPPSCEEQGNCPQAKPQVSCVFGEHVKVGDKIFIYCQVSGGDGKTPPALDAQGDSHLQVNNVITQDTQHDGTTACPTGVTCFRITATGLSAGQATVTAVAHVDGVASDPTVGQVTVVDETSGF